MVILEDTRQKLDKTKHIHSQIENLGYEVERSKLFVGDYQIANRGNVVVDTKANMNEVESNLIHQHERFREECIKAQKAGIRLIILIQDEKLKQLADVFGWYNPRKRFTKNATSGNTLAKIMYSMSSKYGVQWEFCSKNEVGKKIIKLLGA